MFKDEGVPIKISQDGTIPVKGKSEIEEALSEFEAKSTTEEKPVVAKPVSSSKDVPGMAGLVIKYSGGLIKEQKTAEYVLLGIVILCMGASMYFFFGGSSSTVPPPINIKATNPNLNP